MSVLPTPVPIDRRTLLDHHRRVRSTTIALCDPLSAEDMAVQVEPHASPAKWHLAHTTWFFETFVLEAHERGFTPYDERFRVLFNSYYHGVGEQHPRRRRGALTRPSIGEVMAYRDTIDERVAALLARCDEATLAVIAPLIELGLHHEQQHQELLLTDVKLLLAANPIRPRYREEPDDGLADPAARGTAGPLGWIGFDAGVVAIGHDGPGFAYDNEGPRHRRFLEPFELADRLVTNAELLAFVEDGGYRRPGPWLDDGWTWVRGGDRRHPEYWRRGDDGWREFTLHGERPLDPEAPACHLSFFEADAYARWAGARLPTEGEWEHASEGEEIAGNLLESGRLHPAPAPAPTRAAGGGGLRQMFGDVWEWTRSAHEPYPGYRPEPGAIGEYNGKFMCGSFVLRGGSCATSRSHVRRTYRNFFAPGAVWQLTGLRLARSPR